MSKTDFLKEDPIISNQEWTVWSFVNPKDKVLTKTLHYVNNFMVADLNKMISAQAMQMAKKLNARVTNSISTVGEHLKNSIDEDDKRLYQLFLKYAKKVSIDEDEYIDECRRQYQIDAEEITDRYKIYLADNRVSLDGEFDSANGEALSVRGIKNRGNYGRFADAEKRAKFVRELEPAIHVFVAPVGKWCPVDFEADEVQDQEYMSSGLQTLMAKYHENTEDRNSHFEQRKQEMVSNSGNKSKTTTRDRLREKLQKRKDAKSAADDEAALAATIAKASSSS